MYVIKQSEKSKYIFMNKYCYTLAEAQWWVYEYQLAEKGWSIYVYG